MSTRIFQLRSSLGQSITDFAMDINAALALIGPATPMSFEFTQYRRGVLQCTIAYMPVGDSIIQVFAGFNTDASDQTGSTDDIDAFFIANPDVRAYFVRSVSPRDPSDIRIRRVIVCYTSGGITVDAHPWRKGMRVGRNTTAIIAPGASGPIDVLNADLVAIATPTVLNNGGIAWPVGEEGWVFIDEQAGGWVGYPTCCA